MTYRPNSSSYKFILLRSLMVFLPLIILAKGANEMLEENVLKRSEVWLIALTPYALLAGIESLRRKFYSLEIQSDGTGGAFIKENRLLRRTKSHHCLGEFKYVRVVTDSNSPFIRSANGKEFGFLLGDDQKTEIIEILNNPQR